MTFRGRLGEKLTVKLLIFFFWANVFRFLGALSETPNFFKFYFLFTIVPVSLALVFKFITSLEFLKSFMIISIYGTSLGEIVFVIITFLEIKYMMKTKPNSNHQLELDRFERIHYNNTNKFEINLFSTDLGTSWNFFSSCWSHIQSKFFLT